MSSDNQLMVELFVHEATTLIEQLENKIIESEATNSIENAIDEIFRVMHTIKGNSMMMNYDGIAQTSHALEDLFDFIRSQEPTNMDFNEVTDLVLETVDFIKSEIIKIENDQESIENQELVLKIKEQLFSLQARSTKELGEKDSSKLQKKDKEPIIDELEFDENVTFYEAKIEFDEYAEMVNIRAFSIYDKIQELSKTITAIPDDFEGVNAEEKVREDGLFLVFSTISEESKIEKIFNNTPFVKNKSYTQIKKSEFLDYFTKKDNEKEDLISSIRKKGESIVRREQNYISVRVDKLDKLMNLITELVVTEAMVTRNPDLAGLPLENFNKAVKEMRTIVGDLQDTVMEVRMVPFAMTFLQMRRTVRDISRQTNKKVDLRLVGQDTAVDKGIIEHIAGPLMHIVRNAVDHGIESPAERITKGKAETGEVILEAKRDGGEVHIIVRDDGAGLDKEKILAKAQEKDLLYKDVSEYTEREIYEYILEPGFSTNEEATSFSGRGVGMDVVARGIEKIGGKIRIESKKDKGTVVTLTIPLTLAIFDAILVQVGDVKYGIPITSINQMIKPKESDLIKDPQGNEMILYQDKVLKINRLYKGKEKDDSNVLDGVLMYVEHNDKSACLLVDEILGEYQLVVKQLPMFVMDVVSLSGCALLGDGSICLVANLSEIV